MPIPAGRLTNVNSFIPPGGALGTAFSIPTGEGVLRALTQFKYYSSTIARFSSGNPFRYENHWSHNDSGDINVGVARTSFGPG